MEVAEEAYLSLFVKFYLWKTMQNLWKRCGKIPHFLWISLWKSAMKCAKSARFPTPVKCAKSAHPYNHIYQ